MVELVQSEFSILYPTHDLAVAPALCWRGKANLALAAGTNSLNACLGPDVGFVQAVLRAEFPGLWLDAMSSLVLIMKKGPPASMPPSQAWISVAGMPTFPNGCLLWTRHASSNEGS